MRTRRDRRRPDGERVGKETRPHQDPVERVRARMCGERDWGRKRSRHRNRRRRGEGYFIQEGQACPKGSDGRIDGHADSGSRTAGQACRRTGSRA